MPLFTYICSKCGSIEEKFFHTMEDCAEIYCEKCGEKCERQLSLFDNRVFYDAKTTYEEKLVPEINKIREKVAKGSDKEFLDICGDK